MSNDLDYNFYKPPSEYAAARLTPDSPLEIHPNRSTNTARQLVLLGTVNIAAALAGLGFTNAGVWPVGIFPPMASLGLSVAFAVNNRALAQHEVLRLTQNELIVEHYKNKSAEPRVQHLQRNWLRAVIGPEPGERLLLQSHSTVHTAIADFLPVADRKMLANILNVSLEENQLNWC